MALSTEFNNVVLSVEEFDTRFSEGKIPVVDALACSTMGLGRFLSDIHGKDLAVPQYLETIPTHLRIQRNWLTKSKQLSHAPDAPDIIRLNRIFNGSARGIDVLLLENPEVVAYHLKWNDPYGVLKLDLSTIIDPELSADTRESMAYRMLVGHFGEPKLEELARSASQREGVQVIYGGEHFGGYIAQATKPDPNHEMARKSTQRLPSNFVRYVLPLGEYEKTALEAASPSR